MGANAQWIAYLSALTLETAAPNIREAYRHMKYQDTESLIEAIIYITDH